MNSFKAKYAGDCRYCGHFKVGDKIVKLPRPVIVTRDSQFPGGALDYDKEVRYAHLHCYRHAIEHSPEQFELTAPKSCPIHGQSVHPEEEDCPICGRTLS